MVHDHDDSIKNINIDNNVNNISINEINLSHVNESKGIIIHYSKENGSPPVEKVKFEGLDDKNSIDSSETDKLPPIPDGGWGWVVVVAAFLVAACADGLTFSFGLLHEEFTRHFETTQSKTSLIGSLFIATPLLAGPIMSALVDRYGCRLMTIAAGILSTLGFLLAAISNSIEMLCLTLGLLSGLAMGILYVTGVVSVAFWFDKKRNLAISLASCGIGFGTLVYSPMTHYFLDVYDWRNTIVLLAGTLLNMCVCGMLMRNPEWLEIKQKRERKLAKSRSKRSSSAGSVSSRSIEESVFLDAEELKILLKSGQSPEYILETLKTTIAEAEQLKTTTQINSDPLFKRIHSFIHLPTFIQRNEKVPAEVIEKLMTNNHLYNIILQNYPEMIMRRKSLVDLNVESPPANALKEPTTIAMAIKIKKSKTNDALGVNKGDIKTNEIKKDLDKTAINDGHYNTKSTNDKSNMSISNDQNNTDNKSRRTNNASSKDIKVQENVTNWFSRQLSINHHYLRDMPLYGSTIMRRGAMLNIPRYKLRASSLPDIYKNSMLSLSSFSDIENKWYHRIQDKMKSTFELKMFTEFHFLMFNLSALILSVWYIVPYFFLKSYMTSVNVDGGEMMISIIGIASSVGIVALGWAGDQPWVNVQKTYAVCLIICGMSVFVYPFVITNYWILALISTIFGLSFASSYSYIPAILMELMPIEKFTVSYGLILLSQGVGHLAGPPIGGLLYDVTGKWDLTFYTGGVWLVISGILMGLIPYTKNFRMCGTSPPLKWIEEQNKV